MKHLSLILLVFVLSTCPFDMTYAFFDKDIRLLTMQDGLVDNTITCIYRDKDGFMWFGTNNGLSRYDGKTMTNFSISGSSGAIEEIVGLSEDYLGIISGGHLHCFDRKTGCFISIISEHEETKMTVSRLLPMDDTSFWGISGTKLQLFQWKMQQEKNSHAAVVSIKRKDVFELLSGKDDLLSGFCYDENEDVLWLTSYSGYLLRFRPKDPSDFQKIRFDTMGSVRVTSVMCNNHIVWISTISRGIIRYHVQTKRLDRISYGGVEKGNMLSHTDVYQTIPMDNHRFLAVTWSGYTVLTQDKDHPEELTTEIYNNTVSQIQRNLETRMISAYYDPKGILWIGTNGGGVMYSDLRSQFYSRYYQERHNEICSIVMDDNRYVWLATFHKGIMKSTRPHLQGERLAFERVDMGNGKQGETVLCSFKDKRRNIWFGSADGTLAVYNGATRKITVHSLLVDGIVNRSSVWALHIDTKNNVWIGTEQGLLLYDCETNVCSRPVVERFFQRETPLLVRAITETKGGTLWLGTSNAGVCRLTVSPAGSLSIKEGYEREINMEAPSVRSLLASSDDNLYVGYIDGFVVLSPRQDRIIRSYTTKDGLCSNFVGCITEDGEGHIWIGSNSGISRYSRHQHLFYNYYIAGSNRSALFGDKTLFFGNNQSLTYFNPDEIDVYPDNERVLITGLEVDNRPVEIGKQINDQVILHKGISYTDQIVLSNANRDFSLSFNNLSYSKEQQKYIYRLLPYQENWLISNDGEKASYTNLPVGNYVFEVKNIYPDERTGPVSSLNIVILPHWSQTWWFRLFIVLWLLVGIAYVVKLIKKRQKRLEHEMQMKHELLTVNLEREKERQVRVEREHFFTGVAHELRTPLTLILAPLQELLQQSDPSRLFHRKLQIMHKNANSLHRLVDDLLYVQKIEAGMVKLQLSEVDIVLLVKNLSESFQQMARIKELQFDISLSHEKRLFWIDESQIFSAVQNLLSNAFKYTPSGGNVLLAVSYIMKDGRIYCRIAVSDTGIGISEELQKHVFESFITGENIPKYSTKIGVGLHIVKHTMDLHHGMITLQSSPAEGSTFVLYIPEGKEPLANDAYRLAANTSVESTQETGHSLANTPETNAPLPTSTKKLLVIEDNSEVRQYIVSLFASKYIIYEAGNGEEGVRLAVMELPNLIISDVMMPVKDGFTCCREIRAQQETAHIPIIMLTAKAEDTDVLQGSSSGADDYVMKPFNPEILKAKVDNLILQRERLKRIYTKSLMLKQESEEEKDDPFLQQLIRVIEANLSNEDFNVKILAEQLNMSQPTLYRKVKQRSDCAVVDMIRSIRISKAASLIMENRYSIQEISEMVGYSDTRTLRKHFTEQFGVSPSKYIRDEGDLYEL